MTNTLKSKTTALTLSWDPQDAFAWISNPQHLPHWYGALSGARFIRDDRARVLDLILPMETCDLTVALRVLPNGDGSEVVLTIVQPVDLAIPRYNEFLRESEKALQRLLAQASQQLAHDEPVAEPISAPETETRLDLPTTGKKLYVGNLPFQWTDDQLRSQFAEQGAVQLAEIARFRGRNGNGRSRGFGFVEMGSEAEAQTAIEKLHGTLAGERKIVVRLARSQESRPSEAPSAEAPAPGQETAAPEKNFNTHEAEASGSLPAGRQAASAPAPRGKGPRSHRGGRGRSRRSGSSAPSNQNSRPPRETGISNNSGYEIFPRRSPTSFDSQPTPRSSSVPPRTSIEASPYFDDTGDIENRGNRPPRRRRR